MTRLKVVTAAAHKPGRMIQTMLTKDDKYTDQGHDYHEERYGQYVLRAVPQRVAKLGMQTALTSRPA